MPKYEITFHYEREFDLVVEADSLEDARDGVLGVFEKYQLDYLVEHPDEVGIDSLEEVDYARDLHVKYAFEKDEDDDEEETED